MSQLNALIGNVKKVNYFNDAVAFALYLMGVEGYPLMSQYAAYDMDEDGKMLKNKRGTRGKAAIANPFLGRGLTKYAVSKLTVSFDYYKKVEKREGELGATQGNWIQAVVINGKITPLATHKGDIVTRLKDGIDVNSEEAKKIANQVAVMDDNGSVIFNTDKPRLYLRYEIVRRGNEESRNDNTMVSRSSYQTADGTVIDKKDLEDYLPERKPRTDETDVQLTSLDNIVELRFNGEIWRNMNADAALDIATLIENADAELARRKAAADAAAKASV